ncbi:MAG: TetR family transcriptional regulator [Pauljensenia sp.]
MRPNSEGSTAGRILEAAIRRFAEDGLDAPLRAIAADAGVSAPLILHHFGSRAGLRAACDARVAAVTKESKSAVLDPMTGVASFTDQASRVGEYAEIIGYIIRQLQAGDDSTARLVDSLSATTQEYLEAGVETGTVRPSLFPTDRARVLVESSLGALLLGLPTTGERIDLERLPDQLDAHYRRIAGPFLELYTHGLFTGPELLDAHLASGAGGGDVSAVVSRSPSSPVDVRDTSAPPRNSRDAPPSHPAAPGPGPAPSAPVPSPPPTQEDPDE